MLTTDGNTSLNLDDGSEKSPKGDAPAGKITEIMEDVQPTNEWEVQLWKPLRLTLPDLPAPPQGPDLRLDTAVDF